MFRSLHKVFILILIALLVLAACTASNSETPNEDDNTAQEMDMSEEEHADHTDHEEHDEGETERVPNDGAIVRIVSPEDGATLSAQDLVVEIATENFDLGDEDKHWHVYVDGTSWGMIMGSDVSYVLNGVEPGEHHIAVYLSVGTHEELEDGASIMVTVEE